MLMYGGGRPWVQDSMANKQIGNTAHAWRGLDTSFQDDLLDESVLTAFQRRKSRDEFSSSHCVLLVRSMQVGKIPEEEG